MKFKAVISRTTTDEMRSKMLSPLGVRLVLDTYMTPQKFAELIEKFYEAEFEVEIKPVN